MHLTKSDVDAVSIVLRVEGELRFSILLTRGGLTKRMGSSEATDPDPVMVQGGTDSCFEDFMAALPEGLLAQGGRFRDEGRDGPRHDWKFEFTSGPNLLTYDITYHWGSASLPDEFADMVVRAEALTHTWHVAGVAEATGAPMPAAAESRSERAVAAEAPVGVGAPGPPRGRTPGPLMATREQIALAVLLDLFALSIPYSFLHWITVGGEERMGPPGGALVLFAIVEFVLLQIARRSPGYWLLGISAPLGEKPRSDPTRPARESTALLASGTGLCALGVGGLTSWTTYHTAVPYFGLSLPLWLSIPVTLLGSVGLALAGVLVLRLDVRGVWLGGGIVLLTLLVNIASWGAWPGFVETAMSNWRSYMGRPLPEGPPGMSGLLPLLVVAVLIALLVGLYESWKRLDGRSVAQLFGAPRAGVVADPDRA